MREKTVSKKGVFKYVVHTNTQVLFLGSSADAGSGQSQEFNRPNVIIKLIVFPNNRMTRLER